MKKISTKDRAMLASRPAPVESTQPASAASITPVRHEPKTGPGSMLAFMDRKDETAQENKRLKEELSKWDDSVPGVRLDPKLIHASRFANRDQKSFESDEFDELKDEIESAGGNVQPIKVRPLPRRPGEYEIVFGHRRHRACLKLGLNVLAIIEDLTDIQLFEQMDRENRQRADLRPYEQGVMYKKALDVGLFPSARKLAESLGVDLGGVGKYISLAKLPSDVLNAFPSPLDLQQRWATDLSQAIQKNPDVVLMRAKEIQQMDPRPLAAQVYKTLTAEEGGSSELPPFESPVLIKGRGGQTGEISFNPKKKSFEISLKGVDEKHLSELKKVIQSFIS